MREAECARSPGGGCGDEGRHASLPILDLENPASLLGGPWLVPESVSQ